MQESQVEIQFSPIALAASIFLCLAGIRVGWTGLGKIAWKVVTGGHRAIGRVVAIIELVGASHCAIS
jgi:hypothetical protein